MFKILYGGVNPFEGLAPTPLIERSISPVFLAKRNGEIESYTLKGMIVGSKCPEDSEDDSEFTYFWTAANQLISNFSTPFQSFQIVEEAGENTGILFANGHAMVRSVDFEDSKYAGVLPFTVSLDVFKEGSFEVYGITEPSQEVSFSEEPNGDVTISIVTSASGFNTDTPAIDNAIEFVHGLTGLSGILHPTFISDANLDSAILISLDKTINRLTAKYEVSETWVYNKLGNVSSHSIYSKTVNVESNQEGAKVTVSGRLVGAISETFANLRANFNALDIFAMAEEVYEETSTGELYVKPLSKQITENTLERSIDFSYSYSDQLLEDPYIEDSLSVSIDHLNNKTCVNASVTIRSTDSCPTTRWTKVKDYAALFSIIDWIDERLIELGYTVVMPNAANSSSISYNEQAGVITITAGVCDKKVIVPEGFDDLNYTISVVPAMPTFVPFQGIDCFGAQTVQKLIGLRRRTLSIQGDGRISNCSTYAAAKATLLDYIDGIKLANTEGDTLFLTNHNVSQGTGENKNIINFSFAWNEKADKIFEDSLLHSPLSS